MWLTRFSPNRDLTDARFVPNWDGSGYVLDSPVEKYAQVLDKLRSREGKTVWVESTLKEELKYTGLGAVGHREWRKVCYVLCTRHHVCIMNQPSIYLLYIYIYIYIYINHFII